MGVNDLAKRWADQANSNVPKEYAAYGLHHKYLSGDNQDAGRYDAACELNYVAYEAWHPVSESPTDADTNLAREVIVLFGDGSVDLLPVHEVNELATDLPDIARQAKWARVKDVVLTSTDKL